MQHKNLPTLIFFEKPGCASNAQQKKLLRAAGFELDVHSLLAKPWTAEELADFFGSMPVAERFNKSAPDIKQGLIKPKCLSEQEAFALMLDNHLLIRRPLIQSADKKWAGFDLPAILSHFCLQHEFAAAGDNVSEECSKTIARDSSAQENCSRVVGCNP